jgi:hypothetical protein
MNCITIACIALLQPKMADNAKEMKQVEWIVGAWSGEGEMKEAGKYTYDIDFSWTLNKNFLKVTETLKTREAMMWHSTGLLGWDTQKKQFAWFHFGFDGTIGWTRTKGAGAEGLMVMEGQLTGGGPFANFRVTFKQTGKDGMNSRIEFKGEKEDRLFLSTDFKRAKQGAEHKVEAKDAGRLQKFEWMIGTWIGHGETPGIGKYEEEYVLARAHSGNFIRNDYWMRVDGKVVWHDTGLIGFDVDKRKHVATNFGMDGTIGGGEAANEDGDTCTWEGELTGPGQTGKYRSTVKRVDADTMSMTCERMDGEKWVPQGPQGTLKRKK